jgi:hypothetical protein
VTRSRWQSSLHTTALRIASTASIIRAAARSVISVIEAINHSRVRLQQQLRSSRVVSSHSSHSSHSLRSAVSALSVSAAVSVLSARSVVRYMRIESQGSQERTKSIESVQSVWSIRRAQSVLSV